MRARSVCVWSVVEPFHEHGIRLSLGSTIPLLPPLERRFVERTPSSVLGVCFKIFDHLPISCYGIALNEYLLRMWWWFSFAGFINVQILIRVSKNFIDLSQECSNSNQFRSFFRSRIVFIWNGEEKGRYISCSVTWLVFINVYIYKKRYLRSKSLSLIAS